MNASQGGANLHQVAKIHLGAKIHPGVNVAHEHGLKSHEINLILFYIFYIHLAQIRKQKEQVQLFCI